MSRCSDSTKNQSHPQRLLKVNPLRNLNNYFRIRVNLFRKRVNNVRLLRNDIRKRVNLFQYKAVFRKQACLKHNPQAVVVSVSNHQNRLGEQRALVHDLMNHGVNNPVVFCQAYKHSQEEKSLFQLESAADMGALMMDGALRYASQHNPVIPSQCLV